MMSIDFSYGKHCYVVIETWKTVFFEETRSEIIGVWEDKESAEKEMQKMMINNNNSHFKIIRCIFYEKE